MRVRSTVTGGFTTANSRVISHRNSCAGSWNTVSTQNSSTGVQTTKIIEDTPTPGFLSLLKCGKFLPLNPVTITTTTETRVAGNGTHSWGFSGGCYRDQNVGPLWLSRTWLADLPPIDEAIVDQVATEAIAKAKASVWDTLTEIAELKQTVELVFTQWDRVQRFALTAARLARDFVRRRKRKTRKRRPSKFWRQLWDRRFAELWLEYRYGWLPAIYSVEDAVKALEKEIAKGSLVRGSSKSIVDLTDAKSVSTKPQTYTFRDEVYTCTGIRTYRGKAFVEVLDDRVRFGADPLVTTWEKIPYSFIADWFLAVGTWLQAVSPFSGTRLLGSMVSVKDSYTRQQTFAETYSGSGHGGSFTGLTTTLEVESYVRFPHGAGESPSWNVRLNWKRITDLVALLLSGPNRVMRYQN